MGIGLYKSAVVIQYGGTLLLYGDGFEVYHHFKGGTSKILAENIEVEVKAIGQNSRGCKTRMNSNGRDYYGFIRETKCPAVICEGCFVDNATDVQIADNIEKQKPLA